MKKLLTLALVLASANAFATRSRVTALGSAAHLLDESTIFGSPADIMSVADSLTIESGATSFVVSGTGTSNTPAQTAEAMLIRSMGESKFGFALGHKDQRSYDQRSDAATRLGTIGTSSLNFMGQQNPIELTYGTKASGMNVAGTLVYSNYNDKKNQVKESTTSLRLGASTDMWTGILDAGLVDTWEASTINDKYEAKTPIYGFFGYNMSPETYVYGSIDSRGYKVKDNNTDSLNVEKMAYTVGFTNSSKKDGSEVFWGASLVNAVSKEKIADRKVTEFNMPFIIGMEVDAASWLTLRGSVTQKVLLYDYKDETGSTTSSEYSPNTNSTTVAAGAGLKFGKLMIDGSLLANNSQDINFGSGKLLTTVGMTYNF